MTSPFDKIPAELRSLPQWVCWRLEDRNGKPTKVPLCPANGRPASSTDPGTWGTFEEAVTAFQRDGLSGVGFVFSEGDPFCGVDMDHVRDPQAQTVAPWARDLVTRFASYAELSQSGTGAHVIIRGRIPGERRRKSIDGNGQGLEMYDRGRFFVMTGRKLSGTPDTVEDRQAVLEAVYAEHFGTTQPAPAAQPEPARVPAQLALDDQELIEKAGNAKNGATFTALWRGDWESAGYGSQSDADAALLGMLRFWTGGDKARSFALFAKSGLHREKWAEREDYRERTWTKVASGETYAPPIPVSVGASQPTPAGPPAEWGTPQPFTSADVELLPWPWDAFPAVLADMGREIVRCIGTSDELPGLSLLCAAGIALRNRLKVQIKPGHVQFPNLYGLAVLGPGEKKTPVGKVLLPPFHEWEKEKGRTHKEAVCVWKARASVARSRLKELESQAAKTDGDDREEIVQAIAEQEHILDECPPAPALLAIDATSERLAGLMRDNGGAIGVFTSEGRKVLQIAAGRYTKGAGADLSLWLSGYSGDFCRVDRVSREREPIVLAEPVIAALVMTQPDSLRSMGESSEMRESGFLARWDYICPQSTGGHYRTESILPAVQRRYAETITKLIDLPAVVTDDGATEPMVLPLSADGFQQWRTYHDELAAEAERAKASMPPAYVQHLVKLPERIARFALIFRAVRHVSEGTPLGPIGADEITAAYMVALALMPHAKRAFGLMGQTADHAKARALWEALDERRDKLRQERDREGLGPIEAVKPKDVHRYGWAGIEETEEARRVLEILANKGWLSEPDTIPGHNRGQKHFLYYLHPNPPKPGGAW